MENKYTYTEFKNKLLHEFLETNDKYTRNLTRQEKQEFINQNNFDFHEAYKTETRNLEQGNQNIFETPEETQKYVKGLLFDCEVYYTDQESTKAETGDNMKYPMTYEEFKDKITELYVDVARRRWNDSRETALADLERYFKEYDTDRLKSDYHDCCELYDKAENGETDMPVDNVFSDAHLRSAYVDHIEQYMEFFG